MLEMRPYIDLGDLSELEVLERAEACAEAARLADVELLRVAYQWAVLHDPARLDPAEAAKPGREKSRRYGGEGTASVTEFAGAELGARIARTTYAAGRLIADAQDLRHRHPELWGRVEAGEVRASYARHVCEATRELSKAEAAHVDAEVAESADGRIPWTRFEELVEGKVAAAAPELAAEKEKAARQARFAKRLRGDKHGMGSFMIRTDIASIARIDAAVTALAEKFEGVLRDDPTGGEEHLPEDGGTVMGVDDRRVAAAMALIDPSTALDAVDSGTPTSPAPTSPAPQVTLVVHLSGDEHTETDEHGRPVPRVARVEGHGPVTDEWLRTVLGPRAVFTVHPVFDPVGQAPVDAWEIPARHRRAVRLMSPADCFPFGSSTSSALDVDHTVPYDSGGPPEQSRIGNYGPLSRQHHRVKTHGGWQVQQPFPGIYVWRDPHGGHYLVDHTGTRRVERPTAPEPVPPAVHIHHSPLQVELAGAFAA